MPWKPLKRATFTRPSRQDIIVIIVTTVFAAAVIVYFLIRS